MGLQGSQQFCSGTCKQGKFKVSLGLRASELGGAEAREDHACVWIHDTPAGAREDGDGTTLVGIALRLSDDKSDLQYVGVCASFWARLSRAYGTLRSFFDGLPSAGSAGLLAAVRYADVIATGYVDSIAALGGLYGTRTWRLCRGAKSGLSGYVLRRLWVSRLEWTIWLRGTLAIIG